MSPIILWAIVAVAASPLSVFAQISAQVQCAASYAWASNSLQQNPCLVGAYLEGACNSGDFSIAPLPEGSHYVGPTLLFANSCQCSSVVYSLLSACADCQNRTYISWSVWNTNCSTPFLQLFEVAIPPQTAVPAWAYLNVATSDDMYNPALAEGAINYPESTASGAPTSTAHTSTGTSKPAHKSSSDVGAIAGGVVGGVVFLGALVGLIIFFVLRRRRARTPPSAAYATAYNVGGFTSPPPATKEYSFSTTPFTTMSPDMPPPGSVPKLYDPADPSTYPSSAPTATLHTNDSSLYHDSSHGRYPAAPPPRGAYSGAPEI